MPRDLTHVMAVIPPELLRAIRRGPRSIVRATAKYVVFREGELTGILCRKCHRTSYNPNDIERRYCGNCRVFHEDRDGPGLRADEGSRPARGMAKNPSNRQSNSNTRGEQ